MLTDEEDPQEPDPPPPPQEPEPPAEGRKFGEGEEPPTKPSRRTGFGLGVGIGF
jgi:hypothetical protein